MGILWWIWPFQLLLCNLAEALHLCLLDGFHLQISKLITMSPSVIRQDNMLSFPQSMWSFTQARVIALLDVRARAWFRCPPLWERWSNSSCSGLIRASVLTEPGPHVSVLLSPPLLQNFSLFSSKPCAQMLLKIYKTTLQDIILSWSFSPLLEYKPFGCLP